MDWLWGSSTPANGQQQQPGTPAQPATVAMHQRPLVTVTKEHKDQFFNQFEAYTKEQEDKESIICVDTPTLKIWRKQLPGKVDQQQSFVICCYFEPFFFNNNSKKEKKKKSLEKKKKQISFFSLFLEKMTDSFQIFSILINKSSNSYIHFHK